MTRAGRNVAGDTEVIAEAANDGMAVALTRENAPDVVLMDINMVVSGRS